MHLLWICLLFLPFMVMTSAELNCDPLTQFELNGQCCKMCPPGTKMKTFDSCQNPDCKECDEGRYTDRYTQELECDRQPYCDPNKNFQMAVHKSKKERTVCQCRLGFHCSTASCITCVRHTECGPGQWAAIKGTHSRDTRCERCPNGTFSTETSWEGDCKKWTECESGYQIRQAGTHTSDNICEPSRFRVAIVVPLLVITFAVTCAVIALCVCKGASRNFKVNNCAESGWGGKPKQQKDGRMLLEQPAEPSLHVEEESTFQDALPSQEESRVTPEENDDESGLEISSDVALTDNGNYVTQEDGKKEVLSRQESQTQAFSDYKWICMES